MEAVASSTFSESPRYKPMAADTIKQSSVSSNNICKKECIEKFLQKNKSFLTNISIAICSLNESCPSYKSLNFYIDTYELQLLKSILPFFVHDGFKNLHLMLQLRGRKISGRRGKKKPANKNPSLRAIDWTFTNYSKLELTFINHKNIFSKYHSLLHFHSKRHFDMFRRKKAILLRHPINPNVFIISNVAQLHFFKFYIQYKVYVYINMFLKQIQNHMSKTLKNKRQQHGKSKKRRRQSLITNKTAACVFILNQSKQSNRSSLQDFKKHQNTAHQEGKAKEYQDAELEKKCIKSKQIIDHCLK